MAVSTLSWSNEQLEQSDDQTIMERHQQHIEPFWNSQVSQGFLSGKDGVDIAYAYVIHPEAKNSIAISSGRIESLIKYKELVFNLYHAGFSVFIHDHRGQGLSGRVSEYSQHGHVQDFDDYVVDFKIFYDKVIARKAQQKPMLLCHSMGSAIGALYTLSYPQDFAKVVFCAPMFGIRPALPEWLVCGLVYAHLWLNKLFSTKPWYFLGQGDYKPEPFAHNPLSQSQARYQIFRDTYDDHPQVQLGGVTNRWLAAAHNAMSTIRQKASDIQQPILMLQAGADKIVDNRQQTLVAKRIPRCNILTYTDARHELLMEADKYRDPCLRAIIQFFSA